MHPFSEGSLLSVLKVGSAAIIFATLVAGIVRLANPQAHLVDVQREAINSSKELALHLFTKYVLPFELIGFLLLVVLVGALALAKQKGGTHAEKNGRTCACPCERGGRLAWLLVCLSTFFCRQGFL